MTDHTTFDALSDDELLAELGRALHIADPVPHAVTEYANAGIGLRTIDAELAELVFDSAVDELVGVRSEADTRSVTFRAPGIEIEVAVVSDGERRVLGQIVPAQQAEIVLQSSSEQWSMTTDDFGRFTFDNVTTGPVSMHCTLSGGVTVQTEWVIL